MRAENHTQVRAPLDPAALRRALARPGGLWRAPEVVESTGSTNADLLARALAGEPEGAVLAAEEQRAGRGRMGRTWTSPPRAALTVSVLLKPAVPPARRGWLPLLTGVAVATAVTQVAGVETRIKWPNDLLAADAKLAGILAEAAGDAVVVGIGLNVSTEPAELPSPQPPAGCPPPRCRGRRDRAGPRGTPARHPGRTRALVPGLAAGRRRPGPQRAAPEYIRWSATIGRTVRAELPGGQALSGPVAGVDSDGRLLVRVSSGSEVAVAAGDVVHLR